MNPTLHQPQGRRSLDELVAEAAKRIESGELNPDFVHARLAWDAAVDIALDNLNVAGYQLRGVLDRAKAKHLTLLLESVPKAVGQRSRPRRVK